MKVNIEEMKREFDCIYAERRQMSHISKWHKEKYDNLYFPENLILEKGLVVYKENMQRKDGSLVDISQFFYKKDSDTIEIVLTFGDDVYSVHHIKRNDGFLCTLYFSDEMKESEGFDEEKQRKLGNKYARGFVQLLSYVSGREEERIHVEYKRIATKKGSTLTVRKKRIITITNKIYEYDKNEEKRQFNRLTESWGVRGHWRQYKTGKKSWIKPHIKGHGEKEAKEYRLG